MSCARSTERACTSTKPTPLASSERPGEGTEEHYGGTAHADVVMCTFSKSFGSLGGFVAGDDEVIDYIKHFARPLIFSASMPPATIASVRACLEIIEKEPERVQRLQAIGRKMVAGFKSLGFDVGTAETPIVPLLIGDFEKTLLFWRALFDGGVFTNPVLSPAVPPDSTLIRTSYMAIHTDEELDRILEVAGKAGKELGILPGEAQKNSLSRCRKPLRRGSCSWKTPRLRNLSWRWESMDSTLRRETTPSALRMSALSVAAAASRSL